MSDQDSDSEFNIKHNQYLIKKAEDGKKDQRINDLQRQLAEAREEKQQLKSIANNLLYWDTCPDHYKEKIAKMYGWEEELKEIQLKEKGDE